MAAAYLKPNSMAADLAEGAEQPFARGRAYK